MTSLLFAVVALIAVVTVGVRRWRRGRARRRLPGATMEGAMPVRRFDEIDAAVATRTCWCGNAVINGGETSQAVGDRRYRIIRLVCPECERDELMYFDVTEVFH